MNETKASNPISQISTLLKDYSGFVTAVLLYIQAIFGILETPYPKTVAALTYLVTAIGLWVWRFPRINEKKSRSKTGKTTKQDGSFLDAFKSSSKSQFVLSLGRRRLEGIILAFAAVLSIGGAAYKSPTILEELRGCPVAENETIPMVIVAEFNNISGSKIAFEDKLFSAMRSQFKDNVSLCRYRQSVVKESQAAEELGKRFVADLPDVIVVWGIYDARGLEISISPVHWRDFDASIEVSTSDSETLENWSREYLPQLILSEIDFINGKTDKAIRTLNEVINTAKEKHLPEENPKAFARMSFLLALLHENRYEPDWEADDETPTPETVIAAQEIIDIYNEILRDDPKFDSARLKRGVLYSDLNETENALADFNHVIDEQSTSTFTALAYAHRASLQTTWDPEKKDYLKAIELDPENASYYDLLGYDALFAGDFDTAIAAYKDSIPYLDNETRLIIIEDLSAIDDPSLQGPISEIIDMLQKANLK